MKISNIDEDENIIKKRHTREKKDGLNRIRKSMNGISPSALDIMTQSTHTKKKEIIENVRVFFFLLCRPRFINEILSYA